MARSRLQHPRSKLKFIIIIIVVIIITLIFINRNIERYPPNHPHRCRPAQAGPLSAARAEACSECLLVKFAKILAPNPPTIFQASANWFYVDGPNEPASNASVRPTLNHTLRGLRKYRNGLWKILKYIIGKFQNIQLGARWARR